MEISQFLVYLVQVYEGEILCIEEDLKKDNKTYALIYDKNSSSTSIVNQSIDIDVIKSYSESSKEDEINKLNAYQKLMEDLDLLALTLEDFIKSDKNDNLLKFKNIETGEMFSMLQPYVHYCKSLDCFCIAIINDETGEKSILPVSELYRDSIEDGELIPTYEIIKE